MPTIVDYNVCVRLFVILLLGTAPFLSFRKFSHVDYPHGGCPPNFQLKIGYPLNCFFVLSAKIV